MLKIDPQHCTGCGACVQSCPKHCIYFTEAELGHLMPQIDTDKCIDCGLCEKICPISIQTETPPIQKFYAVVNRDRTVLERSTSGGFFSVLAEYVLSRGGTVYGCCFTESFQTEHIRIERREDLALLRGSKYVQSNTGRTFLEAKRDLQSGRMVLYTGTPCQIAGLKAFLRRKYDNLITADLICHGVGSQRFFDQYMDFLETREGKIRDLRFRDKELAGWACGGILVAESRKHEGRIVRKPYYNYNNYYYYYFLQGAIYRDSCYTCPYASLNRPGDFTMGDFWGVENLNLGLDINRGCSLILTNTTKSVEIFQEICSDIFFREVTEEQATKQNFQLRHPTVRPPVREKLAAQFRDTDGSQIDRDFCQSHKKWLVYLHMKSMLPYPLKVFLRKLRGKLSS